MFETLKGFMAELTDVEEFVVKGMKYGDAKQARKVLQRLIVEARELRKTINDLRKADKE